MQRGLAFLSFLILSVISAGCGGAKAMAPAAAMGAPQAESRAPLEESLFSRATNGQLTEDKLQTILDSELVLELPARVGVLPVVQSEDWRGPGPDYDLPPEGARRLAASLPVGDSFSLVTEMLPIPSGALGMEALREIAARYKLRYILLYGERVKRVQRANGWAAGYITVIGALFLPGSTLRVQGYVEASLFDAKTGLLLFTVRRRIDEQRRSNVWHQEEKLDEMQAKLAAKAADRLGGDVAGALTNLSAALDGEQQRRIAANEERATVDGERSTEDAERKTANGRRSTVDGERSTAGEERSTVDGEPSTQAVTRN